MAENDISFGLLRPADIRPKLSRLIDILITVENYTHLIFLPYSAFTRAVDQVQIYEQRHLYQRSLITKEHQQATHITLQQWLEGLTQDFLEVGRLAGSMRYRLSASVPYDRIVHSNTLALQEQPVPFGRTLSDYIHWKIIGVVEGYQQFLTRIHSLEQDFEGTIAILRTKVDLVLQEQNLSLQDQNRKLLLSVDNTTKSQAILQRTVEGLSVIVIAYYLSGLANYIFKTLHKLGWITNDVLISGIFVPIALGAVLWPYCLGTKTTPSQTLPSRPATRIIRSSQKSEATSFMGIFQSPVIINGNSMSAV